MTVPVGASAALAHELVPDLIGVEAAERPITVDQTNESVVVDERVVVKWLLPPVPSPHPAELVLAHLAAVGFDEMPAFHGVHRVGANVDAVVTAFVPGAEDGWDWSVDDLTNALSAHDSSFAVPIAWSRRAGALTARLHVALATPSDVLSDPVASGSIAGERARGLALLDEALAVTHGDEGERLRVRAGAIRAVIDSIDTSVRIATQPVHGDLHVGQLLRAGDQLLVNDFDGSPVDDAVERRARRSAMVDLASLVQSIDHVGRIVARRRPADTDRIDVFIAVATAVCVAAYEAIRPIAPAERALLSPLRVIQEVHDLVYAARSLPRWLYVPDAALTAIFPVA